MTFQNISLLLIHRILLNTIARRLNPHSTALLRLSKDENGNENAVHIDAGTFVSIGEIFGILTATHVSDEISKRNRLGLIAGREGEVHHFEVERSSLMIVPIASRITDEFGPDTSFILLCNWDKVGTIKAKELFHGWKSIYASLFEWVFLKYA